MASVRQIAGIAYPYYQYGKGLPAEASSSDVYGSALRCFLRTSQRTRVMRPALGLRLLHLVFENTGRILQNALRREIVQGVADEFPQIQILNIDITENDHLVTVNVFYSVQGVEGQTGLIPFGRS